MARWQRLFQHGAWRLRRIAIFICARQIVCSLTAAGELFILTVWRRFDISLRAHNKYG